MWKPCGPVVFGVVASCFAASIEAGDFGRLYGTQIGDDDFLIDIDRSNADWQFIGFTGQSDAMNGLAYDGPNDTLYGIDAGTDRLFSISRITGTATGIGGPGDLGFTNANGLAYDPNQQILYGTDNTTNSLFSIDVNTGVGEFIASIGGGFTEIEGLGYDPRTDTLFGLTDLQESIITINVTTGAATALPIDLPNLVWRGLDFDVEQRVLYASALSDLYRIDPFGMSINFVGTMDGASSVQGLAYVPSPCAIAIFVLATFMRRQRCR